MFNIGEALENYMAGCDKKASSKTMSLLVKAMLAGMMIALGAAAGNVTSHAVTNVGLSRLLAAIVFPVGLMMIVLLGTELFTGDCMMAMTLVGKRQPVKQLIRVLVIVFIGNFIGGGLTAFSVYKTGQFDYSSGLLGAFTIKVALGKVNLAFDSALISGILCNIMVCAAVLMAACAKDVIGKLFSCFFTIMLFVVTGFEHCVANMYYITAGLFAKGNDAYVQKAMEVYGYTEEQLSKLNIKTFLVDNLIPVTIGNFIGGGIIIGLVLLLLNKPKKDK